MIMIKVAYKICNRQLPVVLNSQLLTDLQFKDQYMFITSLQTFTKTIDVMLNQEITLN